MSMLYQKDGWVLLLAQFEVIAIIMDYFPFWRIPLTTVVCFNVLMKLLKEAHSRRLERSELPVLTRRYIKGEM